MVALAFTALAAFGQTKLTFEVASVKPAAPLDMTKMAAQIQQGQMPKIGAHIENGRAEYTYMALRELIVMAYGVKPYQLTGPDWLANQRFDIVAKMPEGSKKDDAKVMLQSLLEERFKLQVHHETKEHPALALVVGKGGPKLKESEGKPAPIDESVPLKPGEMSTESGEGPIRMTVGKDGSASVDMGMKGKMHYHVDPATMTLHLDATQSTMEGFADMLTNFSQIGGTGNKVVVDMTELKGYYDVSIEFSLAELLAMARAAGMDVPAAAGGLTGSNPNAQLAASDPSGASSSVYSAVSSLGLKLEPRKLPLDQLIIDHCEKTATEN